MNTGTRAETVRTNSLSSAASHTVPVGLLGLTR